MPTEIVSAGPMTLVQNQVYAMPARAVRVHSSVVLEISFDGTTWDTLTASDTVGADAGAAFVRSTTANAVATFKPY